MTLSELKLHHYMEKYGRMTSEEALEWAVSDAQIAKDCGPWDPVMGRFLQASEELLNYAELIADT